MNDLVSIIMPSFNTGKFIYETIESVINQTYVNWELIIIDDCSSDNTDEVIKLINDDRIKFYKNEMNKGAAYSRNRALQMVKGKWIAFLDSDDLWLPNKLESQIQFMVDNNYKFSYTKYDRIDENDNDLKVLCSGPKCVTKHKMYNYCYPGCLTVMYDSDLVEKLQIKEIKKNNDYAMWLVLCKKSNCYLLDKNLARYRVRTVSISHDKITKKLKSHYELYRLCDNRSSFVSLIFAIRNIWFGLLKKIKYEKKKKI